MIWFSVTGSACPVGAIYQGDCCIGDRAATSAEIAAATPPPPPTPYTFLQFMGLFTAAEQAAVVGATDTTVKLFLLKCAAADSLLLTDAALKTSLDHLVTQNLLTAARENAILAGTSPAS